jgi:hypothetical protein
MSTITINGNSFNPLASAARDRGLEAEDASKSNYIIVQLAESSISEEDRSALEAKNVEIQEYVGNNTYICGYQPSDLKEIRDLPFVHYANVYLPQFVVQPSLKRPAAAAAPRVLDILTEDPESSRSFRKVDVILHEDAKLTTELIQEIADAAHADKDSVKVSWRLPPSFSIWDAD